MEHIEDNTLHTIIYEEENGSPQSVVAEIISHDDKGVQIKLIDGGKYDKVFIPAHRLVKIKTPKEGQL